MAKFFNLIKAALPSDVSLHELISQAPANFWQENPDVAAMCALKRCPRINWEAYLAQYPDVKQSGIDPCDHFLSNGIYEGRKLISWHPLKRPDLPDAPVVSIVLINFNNEHLLGKCINSVLMQTFANLELIVVDDCSTDKSLEILKNYAQKDKRIKIIVNEQNSATLITRKKGVLAASGRYLMFLDSDDYLAPNACEVAVKAISRGYDMVKFGANVVNSLNAPREAIIDNDNFCNRGQLGEYFNDDIITTIFRDGKISWHVWSFIYLRELCAEAFNELPSEYATGPDDLYALMATARQARNLLKIENRLLFYNFGPGVSATYDKAKVLKYAPAICNTICAVRRYATKHSLNVGINTLYRNLCGDLLERLLPAGSDADVAECFIRLTSQLEFKYVLESLVQRFAKHHNRIAALIQPLANASAQKEIRHIGIFFPGINYGGSETMIEAICNQFADAGYKITLFTEHPATREPRLPDNVNIICLGPADNNGPALLNRLRNLEKAVKSNGIDLFIHAATHLPYILWDLMIMRHAGIPIIFLHHFNFAWSFTEAIAPHRKKMEMVLKSADAVICLSKTEELYLRLQDINAIYIPPMVKQHVYEEREEVPQKIAVLARLGDSIKQVGQSLKVLQRVIAKAPWISMCLIGDFYTPEQREAYKKKAHEYGLEKNIILTGWTDNPDLFLKQCGVLLSVSAWEGFPMNIAEAQSLGLPCVIYDIPIEQAKENPSIISVPQGDFAQAADAIIALLVNPEKWKQLSRLAVKNSHKYAPKTVFEQMKNLVDNFQRSMPLDKRNMSDYKDIIKYSSYYSGKRFPPLWEEEIMKQKG